MPDRMKFELKPQARESQIVGGKNFRFTVLTPCLIRLEYQENGKFENHATQLVLNRDLGNCPFTAEETEKELHIVTERLRLTYTKQEFSPSSLNIRLLGSTTAFLNVWYFGQEVPHYGDEEVNLKGTARTLDGKNGACALGDGLMSKGGISLLDDSFSLTIGEDGWVYPRENTGWDIYFFGYGRNYKQCLQDFYRLCGSTPLLPRYALGNWWSRYYKYSARSYLDLMERFEKEGIPFSVAVLDMDWHLTEETPEGSSGWTGYTWNPALFPEPELFLEQLHKKGLRVSLNVHPDAGVYAHEERYQEMAEAMGIDPESKVPVEFDVTNPAFWKAYFQILHNPLEEQGVDFWWIDWQSGENSKVKGMDPLWMLNHYHYLDNSRNGTPGLCLSRYAGPGSHRYPVGFSGDTVISWETLEFLPYFTATAANIGYTWWSHDIGGHMGGCMDHELAVRWVQFGVFSPVNRLHSSNNLFASKEPWNFPPDKAAIMKNFLRLRHRLVPYLFSMNERCHSQGLPLVEPVYYEYPWEEGAYQCRNEYFFGSQLIVCPITEPTGRATLRARGKGWLPKGIWFDFFTGQIYHGNGTVTFHRKLEEIPVLAKAGAILPLADDKNLCAEKNPEELQVLVYPGADNSFTLYEEYEGKPVETVFVLDWECGQIRVFGKNGSWRGLRRDFEFYFPCWKTEGAPDVFADGQKLAVYWQEGKGILSVPVHELGKIGEVTISWKKKQAIKKNEIIHSVFRFLQEAQIPYADKEKVFDSIQNYDGSLASVSKLYEWDLEPGVKDVLNELLL